ncbi:uncharacterized protein LOC120112503 [Phoenix dactylifera]|uniref:Uncharacterized protein LOC120112503 n=1 Tax=Phoenix dactylifera TaxID=42345 RepID=A0A8B9AMK6_PHODC|nr:uncharacterized protein LOC120112503 [Phoenix dactylifera]
MSQPKMITEYRRSGAMPSTFIDSGHVDSALQLLDEMTQKNSTSHTSLIPGLSALSAAVCIQELVGASNTVFCSKSFWMKKVFNEMPKKDVRGLMEFSGSRCGHGGLVNEGLDYFHSMSKRYGTDSSLHHYIRVADLHGIAGRLKEAHNLLCGKPIAANAVASHALLNACLIHGDAATEELTFHRDVETKRVAGEWFLKPDEDGHQAAVIRRHRNRIRAIRDEDGQLVEDPDMIRRVLEGFFRARWSEQTGPAASEGLVPPLIRVTEEDTAALIRPVSAREIQEVMWSLEGDKAPGPDGFPPFFFRRYWMIVGQTVTTAIQQYFSTAVMSTDWQRTLVTLIPKRQDAAEPSHFHPISLCTTLYKVTAKLLALRLRDILPRLISPEQGAFVGGRSITDNVLIAQEFMFDLGRASSRRSLMGIKLDMERAYDMMRWDFVQQSLQGFGFPEAWIRWVMGCIRAPSFAILVNGSPSRYFESSGGLRQGCPLSPLLFIICADALSRALRHAVSTQEMEVYRPVAEATPISHLLFADDCLLLARATRQAALIIWRIFRDYCSMSGQRVNLSKSAIIFSPKTKLSVKTSIVEILGVGEQVGTMRYLGVPISGQRLRSGECTSLELSIRHRLEGWQIHSLSMMGRITLVRSVLSSIPVYLLSNSLIPVATVRKIEQIYRNFIWGRNSGRGGIPLMAWEVVCQPTRYGGLGVQSLVARREVLAARHAARFVLEPSGMWSSLMRAKYGVLALGTHAGRRHSPVWREICARAGLVLPAIRWAIGDGRSIDVLEDCWVTEQPISRLPVMVDTSRLAGLRVRDLMEPGGDCWRMELIRETFGEQLAEMILALHIPAREELDRLVWMPSGRSQVRARDIHSFLSREPARQIEGGWIWRMRVHPRVALFIWKVAWGCLPTRSLLVRRGMRITQCCEECTETEETIDHALLQCPRAREIWRLSPSVLPHSVESTQNLIHWLRVSMRRPSTVEAGICWVYLVYSIWLDRNAGIFEGRRLPPRRVVDRAMLYAREITTAAISFTSEIAMDIWGTFSAVTAPSMSVDGVSGGAGFVIRDYLGRLIAAGGCRTPGFTVVGAELRAAWEGIAYARRVLHAEHICLEGDSSVVIDWIRGVDRYGDGHPLIRETRRLTQEMSNFQASHVFREANSVADWVASFVARHSGEVILTFVGDIPPTLYPLLSFDLAGSGIDWKSADRSIDLSVPS